MEAGHRAFGKRIKEGLINQVPTVISFYYFWQEGAEADQYFVR